MCEFTLFVKNYVPYLWDLSNSFSNSFIDFYSCEVVTWSDMRKNEVLSFDRFISITTVVFKVPLWSKKSLPFLLEILKVCLLNTCLAKFWPLIFIQKLFTLRVNFGFHDPPLVTFKRLDLRGLDPGKVTSKAHQLKISACEHSLLYMQSASLKVWKPKTPVLHINSVVYTRIAFLN